MGVGSICCAMQYEKGRKGDKLEKILRSFLVYSEWGPILPFSEIPEKIQINFQLLSNDTVLRWAQRGLALPWSINNKYNSFSEAPSPPLKF